VTDQQQINTGHSISLSRIKAGAQKDWHEETAQHQEATQTLSEAKRTGTCNHPLATQDYAESVTKSPPSSVQVKHYLDNKAVIHRIESTRSTRMSTPNTMLLPEQDVVVEDNSYLENNAVTRVPLNG
jgi:hypothetical protein